MSTQIEITVDVAQAQIAHLKKQKVELLNFIKQVSDALSLHDGPIRDRRIWELRHASDTVLEMYVQF